MEVHGGPSATESIERVRAAPVGEAFDDATLAVLGIYGALEVASEQSGEGGILTALGVRAAQSALEKAHLGGPLAQVRGLLRSTLLRDEPVLHEPHHVGSFN